MCNKVGKDIPIQTISTSSVKRALNCTAAGVNVEECVEVKVCGNSKVELGKKSVGKSFGMGCGSMNCDTGIEVLD